MMASEPVPSVSEPCCPTPCAMGVLIISDECQSNHKKMARQRFGYTVRENFVLTALPSQFISK